MMKEVKKSSMSFQILNFVNGKTREKPYKKKEKNSNETYLEKTAKRVVQLFSGIEILETAVGIPLKL